MDRYKLRRIIDRLHHGFFIAFLWALLVAMVAIAALALVTAAL